MAKTFAAVGVSRYPNGEVHVHYTSDAEARIKAYTRGKNTDVHFWDLPSEMSKEDALFYLIGQDDVQDLSKDIQDEIQSELDLVQGVDSKPAKRAAAGVVRKTKKSASQMSVQEKNQHTSLDMIQQALNELAKQSEADKDPEVDLAQMEALLNA